MILIYEKLSCTDSVSFSGVCKNRQNINKFPWLLYKSKKQNPWSMMRHCTRTTGTDHYDSTSLRILSSITKIYGELKKENFAGINAIASKRSLLLLTDCTRSMLCCYNIFNSDALSLPSLPGLNESASVKGAFSHLPTSRHSIIFLTRQTTPCSIEIRTYGQDDQEWSNQGEILWNLHRWSGNFHAQKQYVPVIQSSNARA